MILSSSRAPGDVAFGYRLRANACMAKPIGFPRFLAVMRSFEGFGMNTALLPGRRAG